MRPSLTLAIAAGKGGTGKTLVATSLAAALASRYPYQVQLVDSDVEEPNAHLLLETRFHHHSVVEIKVPRVNQQLCTECGKCAELCESNALALINGVLVTFAQLCSGCGLCSYICPTDALTEVPLKVGEVARGKAEGGIELYSGRVEVGLLRASTVTKATKALVDPDMISIIDCPPGTSCPMQESVEGADYALLVTEPTPFGLHDAEEALDTCRALGVPTAVVLNRARGDYPPLEDFKRRTGAEVLLSLPHDRHIAETYSSGGHLLKASEEWREPLLQLFEAVIQRVEAAQAGEAK